MLLSLFELPFICNKGNDNNNKTNNLKDCGGLHRIMHAKLGVEYLVSNQKY